MPFHQRPGLSYCLIDGRPIFLDIDEDRYFRLEGAQEAEFLADARGCELERACIPKPASSAMELGTGPGSPGITTLLQVFALTLRIRRQLRKHALKAVLHGVAHRRETTTSTVDVGGAVALAGRFQRARLYVPVEPTCLLDSLALTRWLAARGVSANIVFGVTDAPFSAHCWVQAGDLVLNDTVGNAMAYTPIRVV